MGRMTTNIMAIGASGTRVVLAGGDLFQLAAQFYGDASEWATIARANGVTDPILAGVQTVLVPPNSANSGGILREVIGSPPEVIVIADIPGPGGVLDFTDPDNAIWNAVI